MRFRPTIQLWSGVLCLLLGFAVQTAQAGTIVKSGFDLLATVSPGTSFAGEQFEGVGLTSYDFGGSIGIVNLASSNTDTIVQRLSDVVTDGGSTAIQLVALQLKTVNMTTFGGMVPLDFYFATLQTARSLAEVGLLGAGTASTGTLTIHFDPEPPMLTDAHGTFDTSGYNVYFDLRQGSLTGTIVASNTTNLDSTGTKWTHSNPNATRIEGVNYLLNGTDESSDFFFGGGVGDDGPHTGPHPVVNSTPEPSSLMIAGLGVVGIVGLRIRRRDKQ